jgi:hypothetical protein
MPEELFMWQDTYLENDKNENFLYKILTHLSRLNHFKWKLDQKISN